MRKAQAAIESLSQESLASLLSGQSIPLSLGDLEHSLAPDEVELYRTIRPEVIASTSGPLTVALDMTLNEELLLEGLAREVINKVNTMRREAGLAVTDRIHLTLAVTERLRQALQLHGDYVWEEVLAKEVDLQPFTEQADVIWELNGEPTGISFQKIP